MNPIVPVILQVLAEIGLWKAGKAFKQSESTEDQTNADADAVEIADDIARKADIADSQAALKDEIGDRIDEVKADMAQRGEALETQVAHCRAEIDQVKVKVSDQATEVKTDIADLRRTLRYILLISTAILLAILGIATKYLFFSA